MKLLKINRFYVLLFVIIGFISSSGAQTPLENQDRVTLSVKAYNLYNVAYQITTRKNTNTFIFNPVVLEMTLITPKEWSSFSGNFGFFHRTFIPEYRGKGMIAANKLLYKTKSFSPAEKTKIADTYQGSLCFFKDIDSNLYISVIRMSGAIVDQLSTSDEEKRLSIYKWDDSIGHADSLPNSVIYTFKLVTDWKSIPENIQGKDLKLSYFYNPAKEYRDGTFNMLNKESDTIPSYTVESNVFRFPLLNTDTQEMADRVDTFIDKSFYNTYPSPYKGLFADITNNRPYFNIQQMKDTLRLKYGIIVSEESHYDIRDNGDTTPYSSIVAAQFRIDYVQHPERKDTCIIKKIDYYTDKSKKSEYLFYGLYSDDSYQDVRTRMELLLYLIYENKYPNELGNWKQKKDYKTRHRIRIISKRWDNSYYNYRITMVYNFSRNRIKRIVIMDPHFNTNID